MSPYACRLACLVETDEFIEDEVALVDVGKKYLAFKTERVDALLVAENLPPVSSVEWVLQDPASAPEGSVATMASQRFVRVEKSSPASTSAPTST